MKKILGYISIAFLSALVIGSIYISTTRQNEPLTEGSPERTVQIYIDNILNDRSIEAYELIAKELRDNSRYSEFINKTSLSYDPYEVETITLVKSEIINDEAIVTVEKSTIETSIPLESTERKSRQTYILVKEDLEWKILETSFPIHCAKDSKIR